MESAELVLLLMGTPNVGEKTLGTILRRTAIAGVSPGDAFAMSPEALAHHWGIPESSAAAILLAGASSRTETALLYRNLTRAGVRITTLLDAAYPARLAERMEDPPPVLLFYGAQSAIERPLFAVANSNGAGEEALSCADRAAEALLDSGFALVTGHNRIAYQRPALVMRRNGGRVCYVLDRGLIEAFGGDLSRALFPAARIWGPAYDPLNDLTISPFPPNAHGIADHNRRRDSIIFALADVIISGYLRPGGHMEAECEAARRRGTAVLSCNEIVSGPSIDSFSFGRKST